MYYSIIVVCLIGNSYLTDQRDFLFLYELSCGQSVVARGFLVLGSFMIEDGK